MNHSFVWTWNDAEMECFDTHFREAGLIEAVTKPNLSGHELTEDRARAREPQAAWLAAAERMLERR